MKVKRKVSDGIEYIYFQCPGCHYEHKMDTSRWKFDGNYEEPTFTPSINFTCTYNQETDTYEPVRCHSFVRSGKIEFLGDCTHSKKSTTVELNLIEDAQ